jgi:uncharacterized protein with GYD domain
MEMGLKVSSVRVITASSDVIAVPVVPDTSTLAIAADGTGVGDVTVNFASEFDATTRSAALSRLAAGMVIAIAALTADVGVPANTKVTEVPPAETASFAVIVIPEGALVTHPERSALMEMGLKVSSVRVITASSDVIAVPVVPDTSTLAIAASGFALALDNPDTPIARERKPVIQTLERLFSLEGFEREMSMLVI